MLHLIVCLALAAAPESGVEIKPYVIEVVDDQTGRGVPLVELKTVHGERYYTDSGGIVAFHEPGLMDQKVFFHVASHGYEFPKDGFGFRGKALDVSPGGKATLKVKRLNIAERLYRVTGAGQYRDTVLAGREAPLERPLLNGQVIGSDSVVNGVYNGRIHWFWGDTNRPAYPLGNFSVPGASSRLPSEGGLDPERGVNLEYFLDEKGFAKATARMPGEGPTWITGLAVLKDRDGKERLLASYMKIKGLLTVYRRGLAEFNDDTEQFDSVLEFEKDAPLFPLGHCFLHKSDGVEYVYFANPYALIRVRATAEDYRNLASYEGFTCLKTGARLMDKKAGAAQLDRGKDGKLRYAWKKDTAVVGPSEQARLIQGGIMREDEAWLKLADVDTGKPIYGHSGSVNWNAYRKRWIMIALEAGGTSALGEIWYSEADAPEGPWLKARKIVTHKNYSFYNPKQHPMFDKDGGRFIFFEGTYTHTFSGNADQTPRYDYNQIMYKLDLADPRLKL
jgi:hypothetical protein